MESERRNLELLRGRGSGVPARSALIGPGKRAEAAIRCSSPGELSGVLHGEQVRKALHLLIALVPSLARRDLDATVALLAGGILFYACAEALRLAGRTVPLVSALTVMASRREERGRPVLGPVTVGLGAMLALLLYPSTAAAAAIYALAFGDSLAALAGQFPGAFRLPLARGKTLAGSLACFLGVFLSTLGLTGRLEAATLVAAAATLLELVPVGDLDNLLLPVGVGLLMSI